MIFLDRFIRKPIGFLVEFFVFCTATAGAYTPAAYQLKITHARSNTYFRQQ